jgi:Lrp/AsnC family leucine-responsive transcriptional regulator
LLAPEKLGFGLTAFIRVTMQGTAEQEGNFEQFVRNEAQILECYDVDGEDTYLLKVRTASPQMLRQLLIVLRLISGVTRTITTIALGRVKEELASAALLTKTAEVRDEQA